MAGILPRSIRAPRPTPPARQGVRYACPKHLGGRNPRESSCHIHPRRRHRPRDRRGDPARARGDRRRDSTGTCRRPAPTSWTSNGGNPLPDAVLESIRRNGIAIKGPITTPVGTGFRSVNVGLRKALDLYAQVRPCKHYPGVRTRYADSRVDLVIVRENTEDLYAGIEFERGTDGAREIAATIERAVRRADPRRLRHLDQADLRGGHAAGRAVRVRLRPPNGRRKVTSVHKANIMKHTDGLWLEVSRAGRGRELRHRVRRPDRRQHVHAARAEARAVRRAGAAEPLRRHRLRPRRRAGRRPRRRARRQLRQRRRGVRADARLGAEVHRARTRSTRSR